MPDEEHFARNFIGGRWQFPAAPYEFEIRSPADSTITAVVPLSSRFDVAGAVAAADQARQGSWADPAERGRVLRAVLDRLAASRDDLARLQAIETGLPLPDSGAAVDVTLSRARTLLSRAVAAGLPPARAVTLSPGRPAGVSGHILSWGAPFTETVASVLPALLRGDAVIVKPSLRGALSPVAVAWLADEAGLPAGVLNIVQGTGVDVGAELISRRGLSALHVRASARTLALAERGHARTNIPLATLRGGGNAVVIGPGPADHDAVMRALAAAVRVNSAGGPFGVPLLAVHAEHAGSVLDALPAALAGTVAAPLPTEPVRRAAVRRIGALAAGGAKTLLGSSIVPDDIAHRMGWRLPPAVLYLGAPDSPAAVAERASEPAGPVLGVLAWRDPAQLRGAFSAARAADGTAFCWGFDEISDLPLPHGRVVDGAAGTAPANGAVLPQTWFGGCA